VLPVTTCKDNRTSPCTRRLNELAATHQKTDATVRCEKGCDVKKAAMRKRLRAKKRCDAKKRKPRTTGPPPHFSESAVVLSRPPVLELGTREGTQLRLDDDGGRNTNSSNASITDFERPAIPHENPRIIPSLRSLRIASGFEPQRSR
jgi:hypothetical protein